VGRERSPRVLSSTVRTLFYMYSSIKCSILSYCTWSSTISTPHRKEFRLRIASVVSEDGGRHHVMLACACIGQDKRRLPDFGEIYLTSSPKIGRRRFSWPIRVSRVPRVWHVHLNSTFLKRHPRPTGSLLPSSCWITMFASNLVQGLLPIE